VLSFTETFRQTARRRETRELNRTLHMILVTRKRSHPAAIASNRCLKRYLSPAASTASSNVKRR